MGFEGQEVMKTIQKESRFRMTPRQIYEALDQYVIGQEKAKRVIAIAAYNHMKRLSSHIRVNKKQLIKKSNILLMGPTGCGKTHIARNLAQILDVPFVTVDATEYTEAGYYGKDVEVIIGELLFKADLNVEQTQRGIIFIDEIDKIARRNQGAKTGAGSRDIGGEGVQQSLLKLLEGQEVFVPLNITQHWNKHDFTQVDTSNILFICAGTFSDLNKGAASANIGFGAKGNQARNKVSIKDLQEYGMIAELLGRLPVLVEMAELKKDELIQVVKDPPDSILKEYRALLSLDGISLNFTKGALEEIVGIAIKKKLGARGLRSIFEELMHDIMFEAPEHKNRSVKISKNFVRDKIGKGN